jgi:pilin isopeptide linkage protein
MITGNKTLVGRDLVDGEFRFTLYAPNGSTALQTVGNVNGSITFGPFTFDEAGTYTYKVRETSNYTQKLTEGVTLDTNEYTVTVEVKDDGKGGLTAVQAGSFTFVNKYSPVEVSNAELNIQGTKIITGREKGLANNEFAFTATDNDGIIVHGSNDASGKITFDTIEYSRDDAGKTFHYSVRELKPENADPNMKYDPRVYAVKVTVKYDAETDKLTLQTDIAGGPIVFRNVYTTEPPPDDIPGEDIPGVDKPGEDIPTMYLGTGNRNLGDCCE